MAKQHVYSSPVTITQDTVRVGSIIYRPQEGIIQVEYLVGDVSGSNFDQSDLEVATIRYNNLGAGLQTTFDDLENKALQYAANNLFPSGSIEDI